MCGVIIEKEVVGLAKEDSDEARQIDFNRL
jgi:hypothetical protein